MCRPVVRILSQELLNNFSHGADILRIDRARERRAGGMQPMWDFRGVAPRRVKFPYFPDPLTLCERGRHNSNMPPTQSSAEDLNGVSHRKWLQLSFLVVELSDFIKSSKR